MDTKLSFHWNRLARGKIVCRLYTVADISAACCGVFRENCRLKLWGRPLAFTHITQSQPLRDRASYSLQHTAVWRIEGVARGINSCINYCRVLKRSLLDVSYATHILFRAIVVTRANYISEHCYDFICRVPMWWKKKERERSIVINFTETDKNRHLTKTELSWFYSWLNKVYNSNKRVW